MEKVTIVHPGGVRCIDRLVVLGMYAQYKLQMMSTLSASEVFALIDGMCVCNPSHTHASKEEWVEYVTIH